VSDVRRWLAARLPEPPAALHARMDEALASLPPAESAAAASLESRLGEAAVACLAAALEKGESRDAAFDLLAADALLTYGCEAAVEAAPGAVARFAAQFGAARLAGLLG